MPLEREVQERRATAHIADVDVLYVKFKQRRDKARRAPVACSEAERHRDVGFRGQEISFSFIFLFLFVS